MIRHIVVFRWKDSFTEEIRARWIEGLEKLQGEIPGLLALQHGPDVLKTDRSWDHVIVADFEDHEALAVYNTHPSHEAIKLLSLPNVRDLAYVDLDLPAGTADTATHTTSPHHQGPLMSTTTPSRGSGCPQLHRTAATARQWRSLTSTRFNSASWRTISATQSRS